MRKGGDEENKMSKEAIATDKKKNQCTLAVFTLDAAAH